MSALTLEKKLMPFEDPVKNALSKWLYTHFPPRPITTQRMHQHYSKAVRILLLEVEEGRAAKTLCQAIEEYLASVIPFLEEYEKNKFALEASSPEEMLRFLMEQHHLSQYDLAPDLGGQPVVSDILSGKRKLTREHIERLSKRFSVNPATFFTNIVK